MRFWYRSCGGGVAVQVQVQVQVQPAGSRSSEDREKRQRRKHRAVRSSVISESVARRWGTRMRRVSEKRRAGNSFAFGEAPMTELPGPSSAVLCFVLHPSSTIPLRVPSSRFTAHSSLSTINSSYISDLIPHDSSSHAARVAPRLRDSCGTQARGRPV